MQTNYSKLDIKNLNCYQPKRERWLEKLHLAYKFCTYNYLNTVLAAAEYLKLFFFAWSKTVPK